MEETVPNVNKIDALSNLIYTRNRKDNGISWEWSMVEMDTHKLQQFGELVRLSSNEVIFRKGDPGEEMYVVLEGTVEILLEQEGKQISVAKLGSGAFVGEMSLLEGLPRSGTAVTNTDCVLVRLGREQFRRLMDEEGELAWRVMKGLSQRIRHLNEEVEQRLSKDLQDMSHTLHEHAHRISEHIKQMAATAKEMDENERRLADQANEVQGISKKIGDMLKFIQHVANQTHILGLNASIEAARSGEYGRGFKVIAEEIRQLSAKSKTNAEEIAALIELIWTKMDQVTTATEHSAQQSDEQSQAMQQMVVAMEEIAGLAERLAKIAHSLG